MLNCMCVYFRLYKKVMNLVEFMQRAAETGENIHYKVQRLGIEWEKTQLPLSQLSEDEIEAVALNWVINRGGRRRKVTIPLRNKKNQQLYTVILYRATRSSLYALEVKECGHAISIWPLHLTADQLRIRHFVTEQDEKEGRSCRYYYAQRRRQTISERIAQI